MTRRQKTHRQNLASTGEPPAPDGGRIALVLTASVLFVFVAGALIDIDATERIIGVAFKSITRGLGAGWQALMIANLGLGLVLALSPWGRRRLGGDGPPTMSYGPWLAVLLCTLLAGGGVFWSAAEPMFHFGAPPPHFAGTPAGTEEAARVALAQSYLHWGFLAWAIVGTLGAIVLMVVHERDGVPLRPRALLRPLLGARSEHPVLGGTIDAVCMLAALAGTIGPLGFLGLQLSYALERTLGIPDGYVSQVAVVGALVAVATTSALLGIERGIAWLSRLNVVLALGLGLFVLLAGPTGALLTRFGGALGTYALHLPAMSTYRADPGWLDFWTVFYWGWFIGYGPAMSVFVARVSRGRTVREIVFAVAIVAPLLTNLWFALLGGAGLDAELAAPGSISTALEEGGLPAVLFAIVDVLPLSALLLPAFILLVFAFLATSADSIAFATAMVTSSRDDPPRWLRAFWAIAMGVVAALLLRMGEGGIKALQSFIVITAAPVSLIMAATLPAAILVLRRPVDAG
ncbi:MAG: BCCT family transporter [Myxococcota bacterium]